MISTDTQTINSHAVPVFGLIAQTVTRLQYGERNSPMGFKSTTYIVAANQSKLIAGREEFCPTVKYA